MRKKSAIFGVAVLGLSGMAGAQQPHDLSLDAPVGSINQHRIPGSPMDAGGWADNFNRPDGPIGGDWTEATGTWGIQSNRGLLTSGAISTLAHNSASLSYRDSVVELDVRNDVAGSHFIGIIIGMGGSNTILVKLQNQDNVPGFEVCGHYLGNMPGSQGGAWAGGMGFFTMNSPFREGRVKIYFPNDDTLRMEVDTDFNGTPDQTYDSPGVSAFAGNLGTGHGIGAWTGLNGSFDNWMLESPGGGGGGLFAVDSNQDLLYSLNAATGASTLVGSTTPAVTPAGLAWDSSTSTMFTIDLSGGTLFTVDTSTGAVTSVGSAGLSGWQGLASDPTDPRGQLYGSNQDGNLYQISSAGTPTLIGPVGPLVTALEFDSRGQLWGIEFFTGEVRRIDKTNASSTVTAIANPVGFQGLAFDDNDVAYGLNTNDDVLYTIDMNTGGTTVVGATGTDFVKGLAFELDGGTPCYPDCDGNTTLDIFDFLCFQDAFVSMDPYANCDGNMVFDIFDFLCFQDAFVLGCP